MNHYVKVELLEHEVFGDLRIIRNIFEDVYFVIEDIYPIIKYDKDAKLTNAKNNLCVDIKYIDAEDLDGKVKTFKCITEQNFSTLLLNSEDMYAIAYFKWFMDKKFERNDVVYFGKTEVIDICEEFEHKVKRHLDGATIGIGFHNDKQICDPSRYKDFNKDDTDEMLSDMADVLLNYDYHLGNFESLSITQALSNIQEFLNKEDEKEISEEESDNK